MGWFSDTCHGLTDVVSDVTGAIYGYGADVLTGGNHGAAATVAGVIDQTVEHGWPAACDLPANISDSFSDTGTSSPSFYPDGGAT